MTPLHPFGLPRLGQVVQLTRPATAPRPAAVQPAKVTQTAPKPLAADPEADPDHETDPAALDARARERGRIRAILTSAPAIVNPVAAAHVAIETSMSRNAAIELLSNVNLTLAPEPQQESLAAQILQAGRKARGELPTEPARRMDPVARSIVEAGKRRRGEE